MRKFIQIIAILFLVFPKLNAQPYQSIFGADSTRWNIYYGSGFMENYIQLLTMVPIMHNGEKYQKVTSGKYPFYHLYFKEDTLVGKTWVSKHPDSSQLLVIDFALNAGDTFIHYDLLYKKEQPFIVDSTKVINGKKWIFIADKDINGYVINFPSTDDRYIFMEGIGSTQMDIIRLATNFDFSHYLICAYKDGIEQTDYQNLAFNGVCDTAITSTHDIDRLNINLYPNPIKDVLLIDNLPPKPHNITLYDLMGKKIGSFQNNSRKFQINMQDLAAGTYIVKIAIESNVAQIYKVVKD